MDDYIDFTTFMILGQEVNIFIEDTDYGRNTVAEACCQFYYLGDAEPDILSAITALESITGKRLTDAEFDKILIENDLLR